MERVRRRFVTIEDLAFAYELRCEGCSWKVIAIGLNFHPSTLKRRLRGLL